MPAINPIDKHVGGRLRMRRLMLNMSQSELGIILGVTFQQIQKYELGANRISASRLQRLCRFLHVPVSFFFEGAPHALGLPDPPQAKAETPSYVNEFLATADGIALAKSFPRIREEKVREAIVTLVQRLGSEPDGA